MLLSALANLKADMLHVLSLCRAICEAQPSRRRLGFGSQLKAWIKRDEIEAKVKGLKEHVNKCYLQFTAFSSARIEQTAARIEDTSHCAVNTTLRVEQSLLVNHVENQIKLKRLEGLMSQVLLEAQFGQGVTKRTMEKVKSQFDRFAAPELTRKWRGLSMDAAKWTFTSDQLKGIVSRAIRQSAEASFIRVLRQETVDSEIPNELHRLEMQRTDIKTQYKMLTRKRANFFDKLTSLLDGTEPADSAYALRVAENLKGICTDLDRLAEDLHSADEQIAQLKSARDVHSASALAMALRKLNASFLKQIAEAEGLRTQMESLEAERDEAWSHAEAIAVEYDNLAERMDSSPWPRGPGAPNQHAQSARLFTVKDSNIRVSTASSSRRSSFSSLSAFIEEIHQDSSISPQHQPEHMSTEILGDTYNSSTAPISEMDNALLERAQDDLYNMLGIAVPERNPQHRSHSLPRSPASGTKSPVSSSDANRSSCLRRRSSIDSSGLPSASAIEDIFSVPRVPQRRPEDTRTDSPSQAYALSTTLTSESVGLDRVHDEAHNMLGISVPDRNSRPIIMSASGDTETSYLSSLATSDGHSDASYSSFLPGKYTPQVAALFIQVFLLLAFNVFFSS
ncbi:hypothetical protein C8J57DRAFT_1273045 [Mycena rebaudengoi]|nr:hypothetical protein C8J57DRAFT_1273045 [Mycena rebaudengoi]